MSKVLAVLKKIWTYLKVNLAGLIGIAQAIIKALKELLTAVVNLLSIFMPAIAAQKVIVTIRNILNALDEWIEKAKPYLVPVV